MDKLKHAEEVWARVKDKLKCHEGEMVALDVDSGDYFLGRTALEAYHQGKKKYPHKQFFFTRVGSKAAFVVT